ncbi:retrovirus-related Pol polyprotein from type-2 retrotransposable element R2DM [Caerostris extrusa]|uniref:Retrovirus-related Pol polyprotein from type-2 retrotransposable element R2DM n=1 Tax=Caerostris extrusa TaxID=172846 RepID=A0AAV4WYI7_CAEEX|nr:retrovirus-related Pol polyprotein from type-2 retrotransposable element R2DM [Caerostris extrusa]
MCASVIASFMMSAKRIIGCDRDTVKALADFEASLDSTIIDIEDVPSAFSSPSTVIDIEDVRDGYSLTCPLTTDVRNSIDGMDAERSKFKDWLLRYDVLSSAQKGFTPHDGVLEHNFIMHKKFEDARTRKKDLCLAWLDVTNAFGALSHCAIDDALVAAQVGDIPQSH